MLKLGEILVAQGLLTNAQLSEALAFQQQHPKKLGEILLEKGFISDQQLTETLGQYFQLPIINLTQQSIDDKALSLVSYSTLAKYTLLPIEVDDQTVTIVTCDPLDVSAIQEIRYLTGLQVRPVLASRKDIVNCLEKYFDSMQTLEAIRNARDVDSKETPIIKLVNSILTKAIKEKTSDIHLEPQKDRLRVRFRIDGMLFEKVTIPKELHRKVISRIKIMAGMDVAESRKPQDGRLSVKEGEQDYDVRISSLPDMYGENLVLRILNKKAIFHSFEDIGLMDHEIDLIKDFVRRPFGMFLITGPTGSGKTTTLYSILNYLNKISTNIITVEDPVEYELDGITQTNINRHTGYTFANAIRHILRHDPNIIMVGEIRDVETAEISIRAALTGHLVLATLHTNSAAGAITRLLDMGIEPFLISSTVIGVLAQRLVRRLCPRCKKEVFLKDKEMKEFKMSFNHELNEAIAQAVGCELCFKTGYSGRIGIFEILKLNDDLRALILKQANEQQLAQLAQEKGLKTLRQAGLEKLLNKVTSFEEILRVTYSEGC